MFEEIFKTIADILSGDKPALMSWDQKTSREFSEREENQSNNP